MEIDEALRSAGLDPGRFRASAGTAGCRSGRVPGDAAQMLWERLRRLFPNTGWWPVIRGAEHAPDELSGAAPEDFWAGPGAIPAGPPRALLLERLRDRCALLGTVIPNLDPAEGFEAVARRVDAFGVNCFPGLTRRGRGRSTRRAAAWSLPPYAIR